MSIERCEKHGRYDTDKHTGCPQCETLTAPAQMPSEPSGKFKADLDLWKTYGRAWREHAESLQAEVERLRQIIDVSVDGARKQMLRAEAAEDRAEQAERKLAEVTK